MARRRRCSWMVAASALYWPAISEKWRACWRCHATRKAAAIRRQPTRVAISAVCLKRVSGCSAAALSTPWTTCQPATGTAAVTAKRARSASGSAAGWSGGAAAMPSRKRPSPAPTSAPVSGRSHAASPGRSRLEGARVRSRMALARTAMRRTPAAPPRPSSVCGRGIAISRSTTDSPSLGADRPGGRWRGAACRRPKRRARRPDARPRAAARRGRRRRCRPGRRAGGPRRGRAGPRTRRRPDAYRGVAGLAPHRAARRRQGRARRRRAGRVRSEPSGCRAENRPSSHVPSVRARPSARAASRASIVACKSASRSTNAKCRLKAATATVTRIAATAPSR